MGPHYRHTQVGWVILGVTAVLLALVWARLPPEAAAAARFPLLLVAALLVLVFSALTVEVDEGAIRLRFGVGLVRKRIPLAEVKGWRAVRNPWYTGWGIRLGPGYVLWNVSGRDAVELDLASGRRFRVGTDEPAALVSAIERVKGVAPATSFPGAGASPVESLGWARMLVVLVPLLALVGAAFWLQLRPPTVTARPDGMTVRSLFYSANVAASDVAAISLAPRLPRVLARTNGFAGAGTLRGHFRVEGLGDGRLYVEQGFAPYVLVRLREGFVIVNFRDPARTRALYDQLARAWPDRVAPAAP